MTEPMESVTVNIAKRKVEALRMLAATYGLTEDQVFGQAADVWGWLASNGFMDREVEVRCGGQSGKVTLPARQQPDAIIDQILPDFFQ